MINRPARLSLAQTPTPLEPLTRLSDELGGPQIFIKRDDLTGSILSGNKVRKLEYLLADAIAQGATHVITSGGVHSNHARATVFACAKLGLKARLILRKDEAPTMVGNYMLDQVGGAEVFVYEPDDYIRNLDRLFEMHSALIAADDGKAYCVPTGGSNGVGLWGYIDVAAELQKQMTELDIDPKYIVCATGSGGTQAGLAMGCHLQRMPQQVMGVAVCDDEAYFQAKVCADHKDWQGRYALDASLPLSNVSTDDRFIGPGYGLADEAVYRTIEQLAQLEGIVLDPVYTGKAMHGLIERIKNGEHSGEESVLFVHTGGIFGIFAHHNNFKSIQG